jgi:hypothetical protein
VKRNYSQRGPAPSPEQYAERSNLLTALTVEPVYNPLRDDPRFRNCCRASAWRNRFIA